MKNMKDINADLLQWSRLVNNPLRSWISLLLVVKKIRIAKQESAKKLHKPIIRKFKKRKVHSSFMDGICDADLMEFAFCYVLLIFSVNTRGLFL